MSIILALYCASAATMAAYVFYHGVLQARPDRRIGVTDRLLLTLTAAGVGVLWFAFVPAAVYAELRARGQRARQRDARRTRTWSAARAG